MKIKIQSTKDVHINGIKCVIYGASGVGKTVLCATAPKPIIISAEKGLLSLADHDIPFIEVSSIQEIGAAFDLIKKSDEYETICLDSLSELAEVVLEDFKKEVADGRQAYMKLSSSFGALIRNFRDLADKNVLFIAKQKRIEDEESGAVTFEPYLPGKVLPFNLPYFVDEVFAYQIDRKGNRYLQTQGDRKFPCKDRSGKLDKQELPNVTDIFNKIKGIT